MKRLFELILQTARVDPAELAPSSSHQPLADNYAIKYRNDLLFRLVQKTHLGRFFAFFRSLLRSWRHAKMRSPIACPGEIAVVALSQNQIAALRPIVNQLRTRGELVPVYLSGGARLGVDAKLEYRFGNFRKLEMWAYLVAIPFLPCLIVRWISSKGYIQRSYRWSLDEYWLSYGLYFLLRKWFQQAKPSALVISNDHMLLPVTLERAARDEGVPTFYIQHACVTDKFPPLRFSYALLDGRDARDKYAAAGKSDTEVSLIGIPKFDAFVERINCSTQLNRLGICISKADDLDAAERLLRELVAADLGIEITVRPHPGALVEMKRHLEGLATELNLEISSADESSFDFLVRHEAILAGVSAIMLEAALLNVTPIHYGLSNSVNDWYGFLSHGLCKSCSSTEELVSYLEAIRNERPATSEVVSYYCESVGKDWHGQSAARAAGIITSKVR